MFINEVPNNAELSAIVVNELRDLYGVKFRKEKKLKNQQVNTKINLIQDICFNCILFSCSNSVTRRYSGFH